MEEDREWVVWMLARETPVAHLSSMELSSESLPGDLAAEITSTPEYGPEYQQSLVGFRISCE